MRGDQVLGRRNGKRGRNGARKEEEACTSTLVQDGNEEEGAGGGGTVLGATEATGAEEEDVVEVEREDVGEEEKAQPSNKVRRGNEELEEEPYIYQLDRELREEMRRRRFRVTGRKREEMILLLKEDDRSQRKIVIGVEHWGGQGGVKRLREEDRGGQEGKREEDASTISREEEEDNWVDVQTTEREAAGRGTEGAASPKQSLRRISPIKGSGKLGGRRGRGAWMGRKEDLLKGRIKSANRGATVSKDTKSKGTNVGIEGEEDTRAGTGPKNWRTTSKD